MMCPECGDDKKQELLSTTNEWRHYCPHCDLRYNDKGQKTAIRTAKSGRNGQEIPLGNHPKNTGGKKGRSGRKPKAFVEWCKSVLENETVRAVAESRAKAGDTKVLEFVAKYSQSPAPTQLNVDATVTFKAVRE